MKLSKLPSEKEIKSAVEIIHFIANDKCIRYITIVEENEALSVHQIAEKLGVLHPEASNYVSVMRISGILNKKRVGENFMYSVNTDKLEKLLAAVDKLMD